MMAFFGRCFRLLRRYAKFLVKNERDKTADDYDGMQDYIERQLTELHYTAVSNDFPNKFISFALTVLFAVLLPYIHIGVLYMKIWVPDKPKIDPYGCTCSCFDTIFRGRYENPGMVTYKHVYFNSTPTTLKIWIFTAVFLLLFYESIRYLVGLLRSGVPIRKSMLFLYFVNLYPHYYSWWSFFSYYNEELYTYFIHHLMFTVTEIMVTGVVLNLCNADNVFSSWKAAMIVTVNLVHMIVAGMDQFIAHVVQGEGHNFQNVRDVGLMIPDFLHVVVAARVFWTQAQKKKLRLSDMCYKEEILFMILFVSLGTLLGRLT